MKKMTTITTVNPKEYLNRGSSKDLMLSIDKKSIDVDLVINVTDAAFKYSGHSYIIEQNGFKGIVFGYHKGDGGNDSDTQGTPASISMNIKTTIQDDKFANWEEGEVRIMIMNEGDKDEFVAMKKYFQTYLNTFEYTEVQDIDFTIFNIYWNSRNQDFEVLFDNPINPIIPIIPGPRFTKDGGVLTLKFRR
ncbi:hypothetical protein DVK85_08050 [Flavobacterium arcticum]|uniref:Uncharacterized protein n=1 Tax=Flavobacterium arcticum TaxID=1784713 RepID=A0A345HC82_9FLAO|nr:hypothetical protein [Flavobacterium arcticum]AXG74192.1 hypothetical protein DVK85_08050 [Flavobacterium arcticum]KAF2508220.1 hypothetical protein E0W72_11245 [Flavobacterium arcticum]